LGKRFRPFGIGLVNGETNEDYEFCYKALKRYNPNYKPRIFIADNAEAITNGFVATFEPENFLIINCWAHVYRRIKLKRCLIDKEKDIKSKIAKEL
jgi:hypothetical protein